MLTANFQRICISFKFTEVEEKTCFSGVTLNKSIRMLQGEINFGINRSIQHTFCRIHPQTVDIFKPSVNPTLRHGDKFCIFHHILEQVSSELVQKAKANLRQHKRHFQVRIDCFNTKVKQKKNSKFK